MTEKKKEVEINDLLQASGKTLVRAECSRALAQSVSILLLGAARISEKLTDFEKQKDHACHVHLPEVNKKLFLASQFLAKVNRAASDYTVEAKNAAALFAKQIEKIDGTGVTGHGSGKKTKSEYTSEEGYHAASQLRDFKNHLIALGRVTTVTASKVAIPKDSAFSEVPFYSASLITVVASAIDLIGTMLESGLVEYTKEEVSKEDKEFAKTVMEAGKRLCETFLKNIHAISAKKPEEN